jgi:adenylosuccinate synthase
MSVDVLLGLQWGDEGKGKVVDYLAPHYNLVARFQGGPNAGHTLEFDGIKHVLHQIPSGIFRPDIINVIGNGVVLDLAILKKEMDGLIKYGIDARENLYISKKAQLILPTHRLLDAAQERAKGAKKIGSTLKGIGPTYADKIARQGLRIGDLLQNDFRSKYDALTEKHRNLLAFYNDPAELDELEKSFFEAVEYIKTCKLADTEYLLEDALKQGKKVLAEGAQGSLLDIDFGSYPFVTSSNTMAAGACTGLGIAPNRMGEVFGIFKAYCTRVGSGPFPTELENETGERMRKEGNEFGATTGRARRCGWLDLPALKYTVMINGVTQLFMMKADVLNIFESIQVCTAYKMGDGSLTDRIPYDMCSELPEPQYTEFKGWNTSLEGITDWKDFPAELKEYVAFIEKEVGVPINIISTGPDRTETIIRNKILA